ERDGLMSASGTRIHMSAERGRAATQNRVQNFQMEPGEPLLAALEEVLSGCADHIGHLDRWPRHLFRTVVGVAIPRQGQRVERAGGGVPVLLRKVEIDGGLFQIAMPQQNLDGPQIRAVFEQVRGETVPQGVGMDFFADTSALSRLSAGKPDDLGGNRMIGGVPSVPGEEPDGGLTPETAPVLAQGLE